MPTISGTSSSLTCVYQTSSGNTKTTGPSSWRRVQALRRTDEGVSPTRTTSSRNLSKSSLPPLDPHLPSPGVAHTKICRGTSTSIFYAGRGIWQSTSGRRLSATVVCAPLKSAARRYPRQIPTSQLTADGSKTTAVSRCRSLAPACSRGELCRSFSLPRRPFRRRRGRRARRRRSG